MQGILPMTSAATSACCGDSAPSTAWNTCPINPFPLIFKCKLTFQTLNQHHFFKSYLRWSSPRIGGRGGACDGPVIVLGINEDATIFDFVIAQCKHVDKYINFFCSAWHCINTGNLVHWNVWSPLRLENNSAKYYKLNFTRHRLPMF